MTDNFKITEEMVLNNLRNVKLSIRKREVAKGVARAVEGNYFSNPHETCLAKIVEVLTEWSFIVPDLSVVCSNKNDQANFACGDDLYLTISWYRMESGRWEIIAYAS